jgi:phage tail sheath protein FI
MVNYAAPGVYVQEIPSGTHSIGRVGTSTLGIVGVAPDPQARKDEAVPIDNWTQFVDTYVGSATAGTALSTAVYGFFANGGGRCWVVNVGPGGDLTGTARTPTGLALLEAIDEVAIIAAPGFTDPQSYEDLIGHCEHPLRQDRVAILDPPEHVSDVSALTRVATAGQAPSAAASAGSAAASAGSAAAGGPAAGAGSTSGAGSEAYRPRQSDFATFYFPWIVTRDPVSGRRVTAPPSGHVAGVWARTDATRGVHKAPANEPVVGAVDLVRRVSKGEQEVLNPAGVNCIRYFAGEGIRVWGARTLAAEAHPYRYINVRRLVNMIKESIADGTRWIVFEPNDYTLWASIRRDLNAFLTNVWRDGALLGRTPQEAFFVKCDEETNPPEVRDAGQVVTIIGLAPVKPAEFVIFKLMQSADATEIEGTGA